MKKITTLILSMILALALSVTAFAATVGTGDQEIDVEGKYQDNTTVSTVYSADVTWGAMQFTYSENGSMTWNPADHTYSDNTIAGWTANGNTVTVTNHSNAEVTASFRFDALSSFSAVTGSFDIAAETLEAGVEGGYDTADEVTATLSLEGTLDENVTDFTKIGTITVNII